MSEKIVLTLYELQALLEKQREICAEYLKDGFIVHSVVLYQMKKYAPLPDLSHLKEKENDWEPSDKNP